MMASPAAPMGVYHRAVRIAAEEAAVTAEMEDDVHHFGLVLTHHGGIMTDILAQAWRTPWSVCPGAVHQLSSLKGRRLEDVRALSADERAEHCTHLYDLVGLAAAHAGEAGFQRLYRIEADHDRSPPSMRLWRDGTDILSWRVENGFVIGSAFDGAALKDLARHVSPCTPEQAEAAFVLRRASLISFVRRLDLDAWDSAMSLNPAAPAGCYARQTQRRGEAMRNRGSSRDFHREGAWPLHEWPKRDR